MNLHAAAAYARHLLTARSTAGHGVHSPFMFSFITEVIGSRGDPAILKEVEGLRREMLADRRVVMVRDLGAGSVLIKERAKSEWQNVSGSDGNHDRLRGGSRGAGERSSREEEPDNGGYTGFLQNSRIQVRERRIRDIAAAAAVSKREAAMLARIAGSLDMILPHERGSGSWNQEINSDGHLPVAEAGDGQFSGAKNCGEKEPLAIIVQADLPVILELGTSLGISTLALALGAPGRRIISIEGSPELAAIARENLVRHRTQNAEVICMEFGDALTGLKNKGVKVALAFIDGNHRGAALTEYVQKIRQMGEEIIIVADDIHMNRDMIKSWQSMVSGNAAGRQAMTGILSAGKAQPDNETSEGKAQPDCKTPDCKAPVSLETFRTGMLFFLRNLTPGHYGVRY